MWWRAVDVRQQQVPIGLGQVLEVHRYTWFREADVARRLLGDPLRVRFERSVGEGLVVRVSKWSKAAWARVVVTGTGAIAQAGGDAGWHWAGTICRELARWPTA